MSNDAGAVVSVLSRVTSDAETWNELISESKLLLKTIPPSLFLHGAATMGVSPAFVARLDLDPQVVASYSTKLVEDSGVARKQYQRIIGEHTRILTYDLLGECTEGYARLLRLLTDVFLPPEKIWECALSLIGEFSLEPFKVLALWISVMLDHPSNFDAFVEWVSCSLWASHPDWISVFKLVGQWDDLAELVAKFIVRNVVEFERIYALVAPTDSGYRTYENRWENVKVQSEQNALAMAVPLVDDDEDDEEEYLQSNKDDTEETEHGAGESDNISNSNETDVDAEKALDEQIQTTFTLLGKVFLELSHSPNEAVESAALNVVYSHPLTFGTSDKVSFGLSSLIAAKLPSVGIAGVTKLIMPQAVVEPAWTMLCELADIDFFRRFLLPSTDLHPHNQPFLWSRSSIERYALYTDLHARVAKSNPIVKARFSQAEKDTKDILKRLTKQDAEHLIVPQLLEIFARCPWPSLNVFINQVENYNIGQLVARSSTSQIAPLAMDMLPLILMQQFTAEGRTTKQQDGLFEERWFKLLAQFAGDVAVAYESFDFVSLIKLVLQQFAEGDFSEVVVIEQLVRRLSGVPAQSNLSLIQVLALNTAEPVRSLVSAAISEQYNPQKSRLLSGLQHDGIIPDLFAALVFAYTHTTGGDAKIVSSQLDQLTNLILTYASLLEEPIDKSLVTEECGVPREFANAITRHRSGPFEFWNLQLYDVVMDQELYTRFMDVCDLKDVERASLSHRLRVKSVLQQLVNAPKPEPTELISRLVLSPADALYTSRYIQVALPEIIPALLTRDVVLTILRTATPLETESFSCFLTDVLTYLYNTSIIGDSTNQMETIRLAHSNVTTAILEAAFPEAAYTSLSNVFSLLQRCLIVFPLFVDHGSDITSRIRLLTTKMEGDLETAVRSLSPQLAKRTGSWQTPSDPTVRQEFADQLTAHNERLLTRLISSVKLVPTDAEAEDAEKEEEKSGRRVDTRKRSRSSRNHRR